MRNAVFSTRLTLAAPTLFVSTRLTARAGFVGLLALSGLGLNVRGAGAQQSPAIPPALAQMPGGPPQTADAAPDDAILPLTDMSGATARKNDANAKNARTFLKTPAPATDVKPPGKVEIRKFQHLQWSPGENFVRSQGRVQVVYTEAGDNAKPITLSAQNVDYNADTGIVTANGGIRLERADGVFTGEATGYNFDAQAGYITNALAVTDYYRMSGDRIETQANGTYVVTNGLFTTCVKGRPDYQIRAKRLTVSPNRFVSARNITFYAGGTRLVYLPFTYRRGLTTGSSAPTPTVGYNRSEGVTLRYRDTPIATPRLTLDYDARLNFVHLPYGFVSFQRNLSASTNNDSLPRGLEPTLEDPLRGFLELLTPPTYREYAESRYEEEYAPRTTLFAVLQNHEFVYNRRRTDLSVSRFPDLGIRFSNLLGRNVAAPAPDAAPPRPVGSTEALLRRVPNALALLDISLAGGVLQEYPTNVTSGRLALRASLASQPLTIGRRLSLRAAVNDWANLYTRGSAYNLFSPEIELNYVPTRTSAFGIGYRYLEDAGHTPFVFDRRDVRHELRLQYQVGGPWAFGIITRYDLERSRAYETELAVLRNFDCMQVGLGYRSRSQGVNIIFNLLPPSPNRAARIKNPLPTPAP